MLLEGLWLFDLPDSQVNANTLGRLRRSAWLYDRTVISFAIYLAPIRGKRMPQIDPSEWGKTVIFVNLGAQVGQ